jgi:hypothetical protein
MGGRKQAMPIPQRALGRLGRSSEPDKLAWACPGCNLRKSDRVEATGPETVLLFRVPHSEGELWPP